MRAALIAAAILLTNGCYLTHELDGGTPPTRDSGVDSRPPPPDGTRPPDARPPPPPDCGDEPWVRVDLGAFPGTKIGPVAASRTTIAWVGTNRIGTTLTRLDRRTLDLAQSPIDPDYMQDAAVYWTGEVFVVAYEHTGSMGSNEGVFITVAEDGIGGFIAPPIQLSPTGGDPNVAGGIVTDRVLVSFYDDGAVITEYSTEIREPVRESVRLDDDLRLSVPVVATPVEYLVGHGESILRIDPESFVASTFASSPSRQLVRRMARNDLAVAVEYYGAFVESYTLDGAFIIDERPEGDDIMIAGFREWFVGVNRRTGRSAIVNPEFANEFDPGDFVPDLASVNHTPTGFVVLSASLPVGNDPLVSLIERCD